MEQEKSLQAKDPSAIQTPQEGTPSPTATPTYHIPLTQPTPKKSFLKKPLFWIAIFILFVFAGAYFFIYQSLENKVSQLTSHQVSPTQTVALTPTPTISYATIDRTNWKVYQNKKYDYSLKYPPFMEVTEGGFSEVDGVLLHDPDTTGFSIEKNYWDTADKENDIFALIITVKKNNDSKSLVQIKNDELIDPYLQQNGFHQEVEPYTIDGEQAFGAPEQSASGLYKIATTHKGKIYFFIFYSELTKTGRAILSTFKFDVQPTTIYSTCRPRPACLDATPRCLIAETADTCPAPTK